MKTLKLVPVFLIALLFCNYTVVAQDEDEEDEVIEEFENEISTIIGVYSGMEHGMFVFAFNDEDGEESTINFNMIAPKAKQLIDLGNKEMIGKKFVVSYSNINEEVEDADGEIEYTSVKTILTLKKS